MSFRSPVMNGEQGAGAYPGDGYGDQDSFSVIDRFSRFDGTFRAERDLRVEGEVKGTIDCNGTLFVAEGAVVAAKIVAENITVAGDLSGEIQCRGRLHLLTSGRLRGRVSTAALVISEGALYEGELAMAEGEDVTPVEPRRPVVMPAQRSEPPVNGSEAAEPAVTPSTFIRRLGGPETPWDPAQADESESS